MLVSCSVQNEVASMDEIAERSGNRSPGTASAPSEDKTAEYRPASDYSEFDLDDKIPSDGEKITFSGSSSDYSGDLAEMREGAFVIYEAGDYILSGDFSGQLIVNAGAEDNVRLIFSDLSISGDTAPVYIVNAKNVSITLAEGSRNIVTDSQNYTFADGEDEPDSAIFSKCDLTINGTGSLEVNGNYGCGIRSKDDLTIVSGNISVNAVKDGIKGRDSVVIRSGEISVVAGEDGVQSNNDEDAKRGYIIIEGGTIEVNAGDDGIRAETWLQIYDGTVTVTKSYEGLEAEKIEVYGGILDITASDDGINASSGSTSSGGDMNAFGGGFDWTDIFGGRNEDSFKGERPNEIPENGFMPDDMPADGMMPDNGEIPEIPPDGMGMPEGMAPDDNMTVPEGKHDRGNMNGGFGGRDRNPGTEMNDDRGGRGGMGFGGMGNEMVEEGVYILIAGGTVRVEAGVDVIDSNGTFTQTGGTVITSGRSLTVYGSPEGIIDCNGSAVSEGGTFIALARSLGNNASAYNNLNGFCWYTGSDADFSSELTVSGSEGEIVSFVPQSSCTMILVSSEQFEHGKTYNVTFGDSAFEYTCTEGITNIR